MRLRRKDSKGGIFVKKRILSLFLAVVTVISLFTVPASAWSAANTKCYTISSGNTTAYTSTSLTTKVGTIYGSDELSILGVYNTNNGVVFKVRYPISNGTKNGYISSSKVLVSTNAKTRYATKKITTYRRNSTSNTYGSISANDEVLVLGTKGSFTQVRYPVSGGYKFAWITNSDANSYLKTYSTISNGIYTFNTALKSNMMLDVYNNQTANGTNVQIYQSNGENSQKFRVTSVGSGWYKITNAVSGKALDVAGGRKGSGVNVQMYTYNGSDAQLWRFYSAGNGYYYIQNKLGYYLDVRGGGTSNGTNVQVYSRNNTNSQKWKLTTTQIVATKATLSSTSFTLSGSGTTKTLTATITPSSASVYWKSSNTSVATVSYSGKSCTVKAVGNGTATISIISGGRTLAKATVTTKNCNAKITLKVPNYKQYDSRWANVYIDTKTIGQVGCTTTCLAMKYSYQTGTTTYPNAMMKKLTYSGNNVVWSSVNRLGYTVSSAYNTKMTNC